MAETLARRRREEVALAIEGAALDLFAERALADVTVEEIAVRAGVAVRTLYRYFPAKEDVFLAYPRRSAARLAAAVVERPMEETPFEAVRNALLEDDADRRETARWIAALGNSDTHERIARNALETMAARFSDAIATRTGSSPDDVEIAMAGWMAASALDVGARQARLTPGMGVPRAHVIAAWDVAGRGIAGLGS